MKTFMFKVNDIIIWGGLSPQSTKLACSRMCMGMLKSWQAYKPRSSQDNKLTSWQIIELLDWKITGWQDGKIDSRMTWWQGKMLFSEKIASDRAGKRKWGASANPELAEDCSRSLQSICPRESLKVSQAREWGNANLMTSKFKVDNPSVPATPPPAAEAIALLAAPELPPPPRALRGACMWSLKICWPFKELNLGSNCPCSTAITFGTNHVVWKRKLWPHLSGTNRYKRQSLGLQNIFHVVSQNRRTIGANLDLTIQPLLKRRTATWPR